jgi:hypothetical protein
MSESALTRGRPRLVEGGHTTAVLYGIGAMGSLIARMLLDKGVRIVGAIARSPEKVVAQRRSRQRRHRFRVVTGLSEVYANPHADTGTDAQPCDQRRSDGGGRCVLCLTADGSR